MNFYIESIILVLILGISIFIVYRHIRETIIKGDFNDKCANCAAKQIAQNLKIK